MRIQGGDNYEVPKMRNGDAAGGTAGAISSMDGEKDRAEQDAECQRENAAIPDLIGLTKGGQADAKEQNQDHEGAEMETKAPHGMDSLSVN